jgi:hypothetical protein
MHQTKYEFLSEVFELEDIESRLNLYPGKIKLNSKELLNLISKHEYSVTRSISNASEATVVKILKHVWPDRPYKKKVDTYLFEKYGFAYCSHCRLVKDKEEFSANKSRLNNVNSHCKVCYTDTTREYQRAYQAHRDALQIKALPIWANKESIKEIYKTCPSNWHVDHIFPLRSTLVCGLHTELNLQHLPALDNIEKRNNFDIEKTYYSWPSLE